MDGTMDNCARPGRLAIAALCASVFSLSAPVAAQGQDPFDFLATVSEQTSGDSADVGDDDRVIARLLLDEYILSEALTLYPVPNGTCVLFEEFLTAFEFPIILDGETQKATGWFISPDRTFAADFLQGRADAAGREVVLSGDDLIRTEEGWCLSFPVLSDLFPIDFEYSSRALEVIAEARELLPLQQRLARRALREKIRPQRRVIEASYPHIESPYRWFDWPSAEIALNSSGSGRGFLGQYSLDIAGDFLKTTAQLRLNGDADTPFETLRLTLQRANENAVELGPLKARGFAAGDIASLGLPLLARPVAGRGFAATNRLLFQPQFFDTTEIRGELPVDWEAELYRDEQLLAFVTDPDENGEYLFSEVFLLPGVNSFEVRLFGPNGETETRKKQFIVGSDSRPKNQLTYSIGLVEGNRALFDFIGLANAGEEGAGVEDDASQPVAYASLEYGLTNRVSARLDAIADLGGSELVTGIAASGFASFLGGFGSLTVATDGGGVPSIEGNFQRRVFDASSISLGFTDFGDFENEISGFGDGRTDWSGTARVDTSFLLAGRSYPTRIRIEAEEAVDGRRIVDVSGRVSSSWRGFNWSKDIDLSTVRSGEGTQSSLAGTVLAGRTVGDVRLRGSFSYSVQDEFEPGSLGLVGQKRFERGSSFQSSLNYNFESGVTGVSAGWSRKFRNLTAAASTQYSTDSAWEVGINLSFSLFRDKTKGTYSVASPGLSRSGSVRPVVFQDLNNDGVLSEGDLPVEGVSFFVQNSRRRETTGRDGSVVIDGLPTGRRISVELQSSSLSDPFLAPIEARMMATVRPGQVINIPFLLQITGIAEGTLSVVIDGVRQPISGTIVEAVNAEGRVLGEQRSEFDGYFSLDGLPVGAYTIRVKDSFLDPEYQMSEPVSVMLSPEDPVLGGIDLLIVERDETLE